MKKSLLSIVAIAGLLATGVELQARHGGGGHHGGGHHGGGWRHGGHRGGHRGWGWGPSVGFGVSLGAPAYDEVAYIDDPYDWYWSRNPRATWDAYGAWLETNSYRLRRPWGYYHGPRYQRRWKSRPSIGFGIGFGI